jgi:CheY-like chemotaxis protein
VYDSNQVLSWYSSVVQSGIAVRAAEMGTKTATVLCIDDEQTALQLRQSLLESAGYKVLAAKSGALGIQIFKSEPVHAVVLDYWMADMNGLQVARQIRKINSSVPIIILSAYGELLDESLGIADLWIRKGEEDPQYLLKRLEQLLKQKAAES